MAHVLIMDGDTRTALAAVRSLSRLGHRTLVTAAAFPALASVSRYADRALTLPSPRHDAARTCECISQIVQEAGIEVILPNTDMTMDLLLRNPECTRGALTAGPDLQAFDACSDKARLFTRAKELGVPIPRNVEISDPTDVATLSSITFPCVLKPHRSEIFVEGHYQHLYVSHVERRELLASSLATYPAAAFPILAQERIRGPAKGVFLLFDHGHCITTFAHRRIRELPPSGGASTCRESIALPEDLRDFSTRLLRDVEWTGVAMVEFKRCEATSIPYLMEINGRLWGSLQLAINSGVDFPGLLIDITLGRDVTPIANYKIGTRCQWFWGEIDYIITNFMALRHGDDHDLSVASSFRAIRDLVAGRLGSARLDVWDMRDLRPFLHESATWFKENIRRVTHHAD